MCVEVGNPMEAVSLHKSCRSAGKHCKMAKVAFFNVFPDSIGVYPPHLDTASTD